MTKDQIQAIFTEHEITERSISSLPEIIEKLTKIAQDAWDDGAHHAVCNDWDEEDLLIHWEKQGKA